MLPDKHHRKTSVAQDIKAQGKKLILALTAAITSEQRESFQLKFAYHVNKRFHKKYGGGRTCIEL